MYESYFALQERPFDLTPDPRYLFLTGGHREALTHLQYGIRGGRGLTLLIGEAGTGKTTLVRTALQLTDENVRIARILSDSEVRTLGLKPYQVKHA